MGLIRSIRGWPRSHIAEIVFLVGLLVLALPCFGIYLVYWDGSAFQAVAYLIAITCIAGWMMVYAVSFCGPGTGAVAAMGSTFALGLKLAAATAYGWAFADFVGTSLRPDQKFGMSAFIAILFFTIAIIQQAVAGTEGLGKKLREMLSELDMVLKGMDKVNRQVHQVMVHARFADSLAEIVKLDPRIVGGRIDESPGRGANPLADASRQAYAAAFRAAVGNIKAWHHAGRQIEDQAPRHPWWQVMELYHQADSRNVMERKLYTAVENYAYLLAVAVGHYITHLPDGHELVIVNSSPFAPKDLIQFPNGGPGSRYYHEPEFYGTYRRLLGQLLKHPHVSAYRILLAGHGSELNAEAGSRSSTKWPLDTIAKLANDCARLHVSPAPILIKRIDATSDQERAQKEDFRCKWDSASTVSQLEINYHIKLPDDNNPDMHLPSGVWCWWYQPMVADYRGYARGYDAWAQTALAREAKVSSARDINANVDDLAISKLRKLAGDDAASASASADAHENFAWAALETSASKMDTSKGGVGSRQEDWFKRAATFALLSEMRQKLQVVKPNVEERVQLLVDMARYTKELDAQAIEMSLNNPVAASGADLGPPASVAIGGNGIAMGAAECWFHLFLIQLELTGFKRGEIVPVWNYFTRQFSVCLAKDRLRVHIPGALNGHVGEKAGESGTAGNTRGLTEEFVLIGSRPKTISKDAREPMAGTDWFCFIGAEISQPFHTCEVTFDFCDDPLAGKRGDSRISLFSTHKEWVERVWQDDESTKQFKEKLDTQLFLVANGGN